MCAHSDVTEPTGIPLLDRLDALSKSAGWRWRKWAGVVLTQEQAFELASAYPDLRALVLQYREERDECESARHQYRKFLVGIIHERDQLQRERDALVEALKNIIEGANDALEEDEPKYMQGALRAIYGTARAALPDAGVR